MSGEYSISKSGLHTILGFSAVLAVILIVIYFDDQYQKQFWQQRLEESKKENTLWVDNFKTLTNCNEMILQLTEKRFYDNSFRDEAWNHYKELC